MPTVYQKIHRLASKQILWLCWRCNPFVRNSKHSLEKQKRKWIQTPKLAKTIYPHTQWVKWQAIETWKGSFIWTHKELPPDSAAPIRFIKHFSIFQLYCFGSLSPSHQHHVQPRKSEKQTTGYLSSAKCHTDRESCRVSCNHAKPLYSSKGGH